jgi:hypothetical protein
MSFRILCLLWPLRSDRMGARWVQFMVDRLLRQGCDVNLIDAKAWFWRPAAIAGIHSRALKPMREQRRHGMLSEMTMIVVSSTSAGPIGETLSTESQRIGPSGDALERAFPRFDDDLIWWSKRGKHSENTKPPPCLRSVTDGRITGQEQVTLTACPFQ